MICWRGGLKWRDLLGFRVWGLLLGALLPSESLGAGASLSLRAGASFAAGGSALGVSAALLGCSDLASGDLMDLWECVGS